MTALIIIIVILCIIESSNDSSSSSKYYSRSDYRRDRRISKKEMKRIRKACEKAEMDAWEDMMACVIAGWDDL